MEKTKEAGCEALASLLDEMGPQRGRLVAIVEACREERTSAQIDEMLAQMPERRVSVYSPVAMRALLERAGALTYVDHDEAPDEVYDENGDLVVPPPVEGGWLATPEALAFCAGLDPYRDLVEALGDDAEHEEVYARVLDLCQGDGCPVREIEAQLADLLEDSERQAGFYVGRLEDVGAIEWRGSWVLTDLGRRYAGL